jgi:hypothetical protein
MNLKIAYSLMKELPLPKLMAAIENANEMPPEEMLADATKIANMLYKEDNDQLLRDLAKVMVATPAITGQLLMKNPALSMLLSSTAIANRLGTVKEIGTSLLSAFEQKTEQHSPLLSRFVKILQEELDSRAR